MRSAHSGASDRGRDASCRRASCRPPRTKPFARCGVQERMADRAFQAPFKVGVDTEEAAGIRARADACKLPFGSAIFDVVTLLDVIEHLRRVWRRLRYRRHSVLLDKWSPRCVDSSRLDNRHLFGLALVAAWHRHYEMSLLLTWASKRAWILFWSARGRLGRCHRATDRVRLPAAPITGAFRSRAVSMGMA